MKSGQLEDGPIMIIVFGCLAVTLSFISFGLGFVNLAIAKGHTDALPVVKPEVSPKDREAGDRTKADVAALHHELEQLMAQIAQAQHSREEDSQKPTGLQAQLVSLQGKATGLLTEIAAKEASLTDLNAKLAAKEGAAREAEFRAAETRRELNAAEQKIEELKISIQDAENKELDITKLGGSMKSPQFIECASGEIVLQPQGTRISIKAIKGSDSKFVAAVRKHEVFFLVRPAGFETFKAALAAAENLNATIGYEPIDADMRFGTVSSGIKFQQ
jgi:hypothetical protein